MIQNNSSDLEKLSLLHRELEYALVAKSGEPLSNIYPASGSYFKRLRDMEMVEERIFDFNREILPLFRKPHTLQSRMLERFIKEYEVEGDYPVFGSAEECLSSFHDTCRHLLNVLWFNGGAAENLPHEDHIINLMTFVGYVKNELNVEEKAMGENKLDLLFLERLCPLM